MGAMLVAETVSNVTGLVPVIDDLITVAIKLYSLVLLHSLSMSVLWLVLSAV